ncbi:Serine/threonine-protein kinase SRPK [Lachnellula arida]|uniref:Serine/threonine-protein kinase SRPK n=1 Tax=Lachnellula arida TaxID=1316785 RepID=A0A8T9B6G0_9HELO|nr:Serine/threonine-protein kinase SRPK [Lachnellula arida]
MASPKDSKNPVALLPPREFPSSGFEVIDPSQMVEEEQLPFYNHQDYYPMRIGEVIKDCYQVVAKLGYGTSSTLYWVIKVHVNTLKYNQELKVFQHLAGVTMEHSGRANIRQLKDSFQLKSCNGIHDVFVMTPLGMSLRTLQEMQKDSIFQQILVTRALDQVLIGVNFLHEADVIHTDLHSDNLLIAITNDSILAKVEDDEIRKPSARKQVNGNIIYVSRYMLGGAGPLIISDLGQARIGNKHAGNAMPIPYRAPEVILNMEWGDAVDIWSIGLLAWDLLERESLFRIYDSKSEEQNDAYHLATMTALLGPPPPEFLNRSEETSKYWDKDGRWNGPVPLPTEKTLQCLAKSLEGDDKDNFLSFVQCLLCWLPEERLTAGQAYYHPWLRGKNLSAGGD